MSDITLWQAILKLKRKPLTGVQCTWFSKIHLLYKTNTRHCFRVMLPERHQWKPTVQAAAVMLRTPPIDGQSPASQPCPLPIYGMQFWERSPVERSHYVVISQDGRKLKLGFTLSCHSNATRAPIANLPNTAQLEGSLYHAPKLHPGPCSSVGVRPRTDRHTHTHAETDARDHNTFCVDLRKM